jgi:hypothetical protein
VNPQEVAILNDLDPAILGIAWRLVGYSEVVLEDTSYRLSVPSYSKPWYSGRRTEAQQKAFFERGLSRLDGSSQQRSKHQSGRAIHFGLRYRQGGRWISHDDAPQEAREVFLILVRKAESYGLTWGGRWRRLRDYHHFEL